MVKQAVQNNFAEHVRTVQDFPEAGVLFYDIAPLVGNGAIFASLISEMAEPLRDEVTKVACFDARGFIFGAPLATELGVGMTMLRKAGKLPGQTKKQDYGLEYGRNTLEIQADALTNEDKVVLVDDVIATGGTAEAGIDIVRSFGANIVQFCAVMDLPHLGGSAKIAERGIEVRSIMQFTGKNNGIAM